MYDVTINYTHEYLRSVTQEDLRVMAEEARATKLALETQKAQTGGFVSRPHLFKKVRRDIARIETEARTR